MAAAVLKGPRLVLTTLEVTINPITEPVDLRAGLPQAKTKQNKQTNKQKPYQVESASPPISRKLDYSFTEQGPAHQSKT